MTQGSHRRKIVVAGADIAGRLIVSGLSASSGVETERAAVIVIPDTAP